MAMFNTEGTKYDVFISYATKDNKLYSNYIDQFREDLMEKMASHPKLKDLQSRPPEVFIDTESLAATGYIDPELQKAVSESMFLVLMVTRNYLDSDWCFRELEYFRARFNYKREEAFERTFIMVLEQEALPEATPWSDEQFGELKPKYTHFYAGSKSDAGPRPRSCNGEVNNDYHQELMRMVGRMEDLYRRAAKHVPETPNDSPQIAEHTGRSQALLGVVSEDLVGIRDHLEAMLTKEGVEVVSLDVKDLGRSRIKALEARLDPSMVFVQLVSYALPVLDISSDLGHLVIQTDLLQRLGNHGPQEMIWCHPANEAGVVTEDKAAETNATVVDYVKSVLRDKPGCSTLDEVVRRITGGGEFTELRKVYVESSKQDSKVGRELRRKLESVWAAKYGREHIPKFYAMPWDKKKEMFCEKLHDCHGVILLYGHKDPRSFEDQVTLIDKTVIALDNPPRQWVAVAPPNDENEGDMLWDTFSFQSEEAIEEVVDDIHEAIVSP